MAKRQQSGGTLALVVTCVFFVIIMGVGLFFVAQLMGGGREAQQATDSGNLNVAKKALLKPDIDPTTDEKLNFGGLFTSGATPKVNLQNYNRFVGKAFLVSLNALAQGTNDAKTHAATELAMVEGDDGMGERLCNELSTGSKTEGFFSSVAMGNTIKMLNWNGNERVRHNDASHKVSFMRQNAKAPSNVHVFNSQIPANAAAQALLTNTNAIQKRGSKNYLVGYTPITVGTLSIFAVPVRPGEQPHLVSQKQFGAEGDSPLAAGGAGTDSFLPPNAFQSHSKSKEMHISSDLQAKSSAIVGTLDVDFPASIPNGFIVVDNQVTPGLSNTIPPFVNDIFADVMMAPGVHLLPSDGFMSKDASVFQAIKTATPNASGNIPLSTVEGKDIKPMPNQTQLNEMHQHLQSQNTIICNNVTAFAEPCKSALNAIQSTYTPNSSGNGGGGTYANLMAVEWLKSEVLRVRGGLPMDGPGCGFAKANGACTGLKAYNHASSYSTVPFGTDGTLDTLMTQSGGSSFKTDIQQRMAQINPTASDFNSVFSTTIPMNTLNYLFYSRSLNRFTIASALPFQAPDLSDSSLKLPDGTPQTLQSQIDDLNGEIINVPGEQGYPNPWDCPASDHGTSLDTSTWIPSSGYLNLLGVIRLRNCASGGGNWCCPC